MDEHSLRCNAGGTKCRRVLKDHAVVTTCYHVFCVECAGNSQLSNQEDISSRVCPICSAHLNNQDDIVVTQLNPTENYKGSVLSGLSPELIMECAQQALNFWAYQSIHETLYQENLVRNLTDRCDKLTKEADFMFEEANRNLTDLQALLRSVRIDRDNTKRKNKELSQALRDKSKRLLSTQEMYDKLKRRAMLGQVQDAAMDAVDQTVEASITANRFIDKVGNQEMKPPIPLFSDHQSNSRLHPGGNGGGRQGDGFQFARNENGESNRAGFGDQQRTLQAQPIQTPSSHRQRIPSGNGLGFREPQAQIGRVASTPMGQPRFLSRQPLTNLTTNGRSPSAGFTGYGMSAGLKVSNPVTTGLGRSGTNSRVAQRPSPSFPAAAFPNRGSGFRPPDRNNFSNGDSYY